MTQLTPPISCHHTNVLTVTLCKATRPISYSSNSGHVPFPSFPFLQPLPLSSPAFSAELMCGAASSGPYKHSHVLMMIIHPFQSFFAPSSKWDTWGLWSPRLGHVSSDQRLCRDRRFHYSTLTLWRGINQHCPIFHTIPYFWGRATTPWVKWERGCKLHVVQTCDSGWKIKVWSHVESYTPSTNYTAS